MSKPLGPSDAAALEECMASGGVAVLPTDTVYGLCCDPENVAAIRRLYELKGRPAQRPAAVMFFALEALLRTLPELGGAERAALEALLPGPVTVLLPNRALRFAPACGPDAATLGLRVPRLAAPLAALAAVRTPVMQSSANISGERDPRRLADVPARLLSGADLVLDGGQLAGTPSTVIDLRHYERNRTWSIVRMGPASEESVRAVLDRCMPRK